MLAKNLLLAALACSAISAIFLACLLAVSSCRLFCLDLPRIAWE
jgi:hypothetical protein